MRIPHRKRKVTTITLSPEIVKKAKEYNLNISRLSEDALREMIKKLEQEKQTGAPEIIKKGGGKEMVSKLTWTVAIIVIAAVAIGAWAILGGAPAAPPAPAPAAPKWISVTGIPTGSKSGIVAVYIAKTGQNYSENWSAVATSDNYYYKFTENGGSGTIPYETPFVILVEVVGHDDNMAYVTKENLMVELSITGSFNMSAENSDTGGDGVEYVFAQSSSEIGVNAVWDNNGNGFKLPAMGSITWTAKLWLWG
jgi:hypothetical protein